MKILYLAIPYRLAGTKEKIGGGEISNRTLLEELAKKNEIHVFSAYGSGLWNEKVNGVEIYDLSEYLHWLGPLSVIFSKCVFRVLYYYKAIKLKPDIILCGPNAVSISVNISKRLKVPSGCFIRAFENFESKGMNDHFGFKNIVKFLLYGNTKKTTINKLNFLLPNSEFMVRKCKEEFSCKYHHVVYPPINVKRHSLYIPTKIKNIVMVSNSEHKGFEIFKDLSKIFNEISFTAVGVQGIPDIEKLSKNLFLKGWQKDPKDFILNADLVLVPSKWEEPFGRIAVEALRYGRMVLVSNVGGLPETVNYNDSLVLESENLEAWVSKIKTLKEFTRIFEKEYHDAISKSEIFSLDTQVEALESFLKQLSHSTEC